MGEFGWLNASLRHHAKEHRKQAAKCRRAYKTEPYKGFCETIANAHDEAAKAFESRIKGEVVE